MKPKECCELWANGDFNFCPDCGAKLQYVRIILDTDYLVPLWNEIYDYVINNGDPNQIEWYLKQRGELSVNVDIDDFCEFCLEDTVMEVI